MRLNEYLKQHDLTPEDFGKKLGVDRTSVIRYVRGTRRPDWDVLQKIVAVTDGAVQPNDFFEGPADQSVA